MNAPSATARIESAIGVIALTATADALTGVRILPKAKGYAEIIGHPLLAESVAQMRAFLAGKLAQFDVPLIPLDTDEGEQLRKGIATIPFGETQTYGAVAQRIGSVARAVGQACKTNPYPIIIPCHRVVSASGPEFYSGGAGPRTKSWLIDFEYDHLPPEQRTRLL